MRERFHRGRELSMFSLCENSVKIAVYSENVVSLFNGTKIISYVVDFSRGCIFFDHVRVN